MTTSAPSRFGWGKMTALIVLAAAGLGGGFFLAGRSQQRPQEKESTPVGREATAHRFSLTEADGRDTLEAPVLTADPGGRVYLAWASRTGEDERTLFLASSDDAGGRFSSPRSVARSGVFKAVSQMKGNTVTRELRMVPHLVAVGTALHLAWTEKRPGGDGVRMVMATSTDRGETWGPSVCVHSVPEARPTFTALAAGEDGSLLASWLDNRNGAQQCYAARRPAGMATFEPEGVVHAGDDDRGVCPCCPTASLRMPDGTSLVAFRNLANGYRDIGIGLRKPGDSAFSLHPVIPPTWEFNGCPHDGPSLARVGNILHVTWMDARNGSQRCYHAWTRLPELTFTAQELHPLSVGTQGNARLYADRTGTLHAVWEESRTVEPPPAGGHRHEPAAPRPGMGGRVVMYRSWPAGAAGFGEARAVLPVPGAFQTRPAITGTPDGRLLLAWNELDETGKTVAVTRLDKPEERR